MDQEAAHDQVEAFDSKSQQWVTRPALQQGRHGSGFAVVDDYLYIASGSGNRGGGPELTSIERLNFLEELKPESQKIDHTPVYSQWLTITLSFVGPETNENSEDNPFLNYKLNFLFQNNDSQYIINGFILLMDRHPNPVLASNGISEQIANKTI